MTKLIDLKDLARFKEHLDERQATTDQAISSANQAISTANRDISNIKQNKLDKNQVELKQEFICDTNGYEYVDLGLPSGTLWATKTVGQKSQYDVKHYSYGEISVKNNYDWDTYKFKGSSSHTYTKYNLEDNKTTLDAEDDVVHVVMGGDWYTPTVEQLRELDQYTTKSQDRLTLTSTINGKSITLSSSCMPYVRNSQYPGWVLASNALASENNTDKSNMYVYVWSPKSVYAAEFIGVSTYPRFYGFAHLGCISPLGTKTTLTIKDTTLDIATKEDVDDIVSPTLPEGFAYDPNEDTTIVTPLEKTYAYGVLIDHTQGPCTADVTRIGNMEMHRTLPIHSKYRRCVWDLDDETILFHLADDNSNNGAEDCTLSASALATLLSTGKSDTHYVSVRVHTPKFYMCGKVIKRDTTGKPILSKVMWSEYRLSSDYREVPEMVTDFRPCFTERGDLLAAGPFTDSQEVSGGSTGKAGCIHPTTNKTRTQFRTLANNKNTYIQSYENYRDIVYWAFVIEYATFQSHRPFTEELTSEGYHQGGLGPGMTSIASYGKGCYADSEENIQESITSAKDDYYDTNPNMTPWPERNHGVTFSLGNHTGENIVTIEKSDKIYTLHQNSYRGFEFPFGDIYTFLDGFLGEFKNGYRNFWVCSKPEQFGDSVPLEENFYTDELDPSENGWYKAYSRPLWWDEKNSIFQSSRDFQAADEVTVVDKYKTLTNGDLFPETCYVKGDEAELDDIGNKYYSNYWYDPISYNPTDTTNLNVLFVGSYASNFDPDSVGLGYFYSDDILSYANFNRGCRCFNIIK